MTDNPFACAPHLGGLSLFLLSGVGLKAAVLVESETTKEEMFLPALSLLLVALVTAQPTIYVKKNSDTLSPVLVPLSSTVIPLPIYKVGYSLNTKGKEIYDDEGKLITLKKKKNAKIGAKVKSLTREDFEKKMAEITKD